MSAPLKNAYDWLSRAYPNNPSPVSEQMGGMISSAGVLGGKDAQACFVQTGKFRKMKIFDEDLEEEKKIRINRFKNSHYFDESGNVISDELKGKLSTFLNEFHSWLIKNKK